MGGEKVLDEFNGINKQSEFGVYADEMNKISDEFRIETQSASDNQKNNKAIKRKKSLLRQALAITMVTVGVVATPNIQLTKKLDINTILNETIEYAKNDDCKSLYELYIKQNAYEFVEKYGEDTYAYNQSQRNWVMTETVGDKSKSYDLFFHNEYRGDYRYVVLFIADFSGEEVNGSIDVLVVYDEGVMLKKGNMDNGRLVDEIEFHDYKVYTSNAHWNSDFWVKGTVGGQGIKGKTQYYDRRINDDDGKEITFKGSLYVDASGNIDIGKTNKLGSIMVKDNVMYFKNNEGIVLGENTFVQDNFIIFYDNNNIETIAKSYLSEIETEE